MAGFAPVGAVPVGALPAAAATSGAPVGTAVEQDTALALTARKVAATGVAVEQDQALALSPTKIRSVGLATETDTALAVGRVKIRAVGLATEADTALALSGASIATLVRPSSDVTTTGWIATPGPGYSTAVDESSADDADYITSPGDTTPITMGLSSALPAGAYNVVVRARDVATSSFRVSLLDAGGTPVGQTDVQAVTATFANYAIPITITGTATQIRIEPQ